MQVHSVANRFAKPAEAPPDHRSSSQTSGVQFDVCSTPILTSPSTLGSQKKSPPPPVGVRRFLSPQGTNSVWLPFFFLVGRAFPCLALPCPFLSRRAHFPFSPYALSFFAVRILPVLTFLPAVLTFFPVLTLLPSFSFSFRPHHLSFVLAHVPMKMPVSTRGSSCAASGGDIEGSRPDVLSAVRPGQVMALTAGSQISSELNQLEQYGGSREMDAATQKVDIFAHTRPRRVSSPTHTLVSSMHAHE